MPDKLTFGQISSGIKLLLGVVPIVLILITSATTYGIASGQNELRINALEDKVKSFEVAQKEDHDKLIQIDANVTNIKDNISTLTVDFKQFMRDHPAIH